MPGCKVDTMAVGAWVKPRDIESSDIEGSPCHHGEPRFGDKPALQKVAEKLPNGIEYELRRLYYDIAGTAYRPAIAALTSFVPTWQILFGSDHPLIPLAETAEGVRQLGFSGADLQRISRDNALEDFL